MAWYPVAMEAANLSEKNTVEEADARWKARQATSTMMLKLSYSGQGDDALPTLLCNGELSNLSALEAGRGQIGNAECSFTPLGDAVPVLVVGRYDRTSTEFSEVYSLEGHKAAARAYSASAQNVASFVRDWFGTPRAKFSVAELPDARAVPFENGNLLLIALADAGAKQNELTAVRQLAHATLSSPRAWIREGLTHFAQALYRERQDGRPAAVEFMKSHEGIMMAAEREQSPNDAKEAAQNSLINTSLEEFYRGKSMYVWWMLRDLAGDAALKSALAAYRADQDKEPSYIQRLLEAESKKDLEWFFDDWVYRDKGLPDFRIASVYPRKTMKDTYLVTVTVENLGNAAAEVPVIAHFAGLDAKERLLVKGKSQASIRLETARMPEDVVVNDGSVPESDTGNNTFKVEAASDK